MKVSKFLLKLSPLAFLFAGMSSGMADTYSDWDKMAGSNIANQIGADAGMDFSGVTDMTTTDVSSRMTENVRDEDIRDGKFNIISDSESGSRRNIDRRSRDIGMAGGPDVDITEGSETDVSNKKSMKGIGQSQGYTLRGERRLLD